MLEDENYWVTLKIMDNHKFWVTLTVVHMLISDWSSASMTWWARSHKNFSRIQRNGWQVEKNSP